MIENVSDTARWVAVYRAMETERPDALFHDPYARTLAGEKGQAIVDHMKGGRKMAWAMVVRTVAFDDMIMAKVTGGGVDVVLNLAAGLDTRAFRLSLPPTLRWIDVDLPGILNYKTESLSGAKPTARYEAITVDLTDVAKRRALFAQIGAESSRVFVLTEGLLIYLSPEQVGTLAADLHAQPSFRWWAIDIASPALLKWMIRSWGKSVEKGNAPFKFAPAAGTKFFEPFGWREAEFRSAIEEARRINREMPRMWLWRLVARFSSAKRREAFRRMSGFVLMERD
jgi:methyltransferase (TIGR00027 family)